MLPAAVAAGDPALSGQPRQVGGPDLGHRGGEQRLAARRLRRDDQVHRLGQQHLLAHVVALSGGRPAVAPTRVAIAIAGDAGGRAGRAGRLGRVGLRLVPEDQRDVHVPGAQHPRRIRRFGLGQPQVHDRVPVAQQRGGGGHDRAERGGEGGQPEPPGAHSAVGRELVLGCVEAADDLGGALGEQPPGIGEPDAPSGPLDELRAGLGLETRQVVADGGLGVVQRVRGRGHRAMPGHGDQHAEPGYVQHGLTIDGIFLSP